MDKNCYCMTLKEASEYSKIGINRLRNIVKDTECPFVLRVGEKKCLVKFDKFKEWLDKAEFI